MYIEIWLPLLLAPVMIISFLWMFRSSEGHTH
jgi:hypothetical protein